MINKLYILLFCLIPLLEYAQVNYEADIQPIFNTNNCINCHSGISPSAGIDLTNYESVMASGTVIDGDYENSLLWQVIESGYMPFGAPDVSNEEVNLLSQWINELGGVELSCDLNFIPISPTSQSNSIAISPDLVTDISFGTEIGLFSLNDAGEYICSSTFIWQGSPDALAGFGAEVDSDGFVSGGEMFFFGNFDGAIYELEVSYLEVPGFSTVWNNGGLSAITSITIINSIECEDEVAGCQDVTACNYNENASDDDGSCILPIGCDTCSGETDGTGTVLNNDLDDDGVCDEDEILGCTNPTAFNYDENATDDDGSCDYIVLGCLSQSACNYNFNANTDDNTCIFPTICESCSGEQDGTGVVVNSSDDADGDGICDSNDPDINGDGLCDNYQDGNIYTDYNCSNGVNSSCSDDIIFSLVQFINNYGECNIWMGADNIFYNGPNPPNGGQPPYSYSWQFNGEEFAVDQLGVSIVNVGLYTVTVTDSNGCQSSADLNIESTLCIDCGDSFNVECENEDILGCLDSTACNYNELANTDDGFCTYPEFGYDCLGECVFLDPNDPNNCLSDYEPIVITNITNDINNNQVTVEWSGGLSIPTIEINLLAYYDFPSGIAYNIDYNLENNGSYTFDIPCSIILDANNDGILDENILLEYAVDINQNFINSNLAPCNTITNDYSFWGNNLEGIGCNDCSSNIVTCSQTNFYTNSNTDLNQLAQVNLSICAEIEGCTDSTAFNYNSEATLEDNSCCFINGCSQPDNILYNPDACFFDDQLCVNVIDCDDIIIPFTTINNVSCFNENDGSVEVVFSSIFGGTPPFTVFWEQLIDTDGDGVDDSQTIVFDPNNDGFLENLPASNYQVTVIDDLGCSGTTIVSVNQPAEININYDISEIVCFVEQSTINIGIEGNIMNYDVSVNGDYIETVYAGSPTITTEQDFEYTATGSNNTIVIFGCDDSDCSDANGIINPGDIIGIFYENVNGDLECGGSATFNGTIPFASLSGWQTEFAMDNGFEDGDSYIWYLFDTSGDIYQLIPSYDLNQGLDYFTPGGFTVITNFDVGTVLGSNDDFNYLVQAGEHLIELEAENGCVASTTIIIDQPNEIQLINSNVVSPTCSGSINGYIDIELSGGTGLYSYEWLGPLGDIISNDEDLFNLSPGTYSITINDQNNCVYTESFVISNTDDIEVDYSYDPISCNGENTNLTINVSGGVPPYEIDYNGEDPNNISSGFYTFSVSDDLGCLESFSVSINNPDGIAINYPAVETVCYGETNIPVDFSMSVSGGTPPYLYEWFDESNVSLGIFSPSATVSPGNYSIVITDSDNCLSVPSYFTISEPEQILVDFDLDAINCFGETATANFTVDGAPGSYTIFFNGIDESTTIGLSDISFDWQNTGVNSSIVISQITGLNLNDGDLIGVFYTSSNGVQCGGTTVYDQSIGFPLSLAAWGEETGQDNGFVNGEDFLFLISSGGLVYEVDVIFNLDVPGFTDVFEVNGLSQIENMNVTGVFSDGPDFSFDSLEEDNYFVEIVDGNGCAWDSTIVVDGANQLLISNEIISSASCFGDLAEISSSVSGGEPPYNYQWQNIINGQIVSTQPQPQLEAGSYFFIVTDSNDCSEFNLVEVDQESGQINISSESETCANEEDGFVQGCVDWAGLITFSISDSTALIDEVNLEGNGIETCHQFNNLSPGDYILTVVSLDGCVISEEVIIDPIDPILVAFDTNPAQCFDEASGSIFIDEIIGGNPPFEINWNGVDTEAILPGFHSFTILDQNGCSKTFNYFIANSPNINTNATVIQNNCFDGEEGTVNLSVSGGNPNFDYVWSNSSGNILGFESSISNLTSDVYFVEITDDNGCIYVESFDISDQNEEFIVLINTVPSDCYAGMGSVSANILNENNSNYNFIWPNGTSNNGENVSLEAGDYELVVVHNSTGCTVLQSFTILEPEEFIIQVEFDEVLCFEDNNNDGINDITTSVNAVILGGADFDIDNDGINNNQDNDIDNDGIINVLDNDIDGDGILNEFDDNGLIWINGDIDNDGIVNDEDTDWDGVNVFVDNNELSPGIYFVYNYDSNGCFTITEFEITSPEELIITVNPNQILCFGEYGSVDLSILGGAPPYEIFWTNQLTGEEVNPSMLIGGDSGIIYDIQVVDQNECSQSDSFIINPEPGEITIDNLDEITSDYNGFEISCNDFSDGWIDLDISGGTPPYTFNWIGPNGVIGNQEDIYDLGAGMYSVTITDLNGCQLFSSFDPFTIEMEEPEEFEVLFTWAENAHCEDSDDGSIIITTNGAVPSFNYIINNVLDTMQGGLFNTNLNINDVFLENENSILIQNLEVGLYSINIISDQNNCISPQFINMNVGYDDENCLWIPSIFSPNSDGVNDTFEIYGMEYYPDASVYIYNRWGVKIYESKNQLYVPWNGSSNGTSNEIGTYYYVVELNTGQKTYSGSITLKR